MIQITYGEQNLWYLQIPEDCDSRGQWLEHGLSAMARQRKDKQEKNYKIPLKHADRSGPDPSRQTLINLAEERNLFKQAEEYNRSEQKVEDEALVGRLGESVLWSFSLSMLHFTLDVLVTHQYAMEIVWRDVVSRAAQAFPSKLVLYSMKHEDMFVNYH